MALGTNEAGLKAQEELYRAAILEFKEKEIDHISRLASGGDVDIASLLSSNHGGIFKFRRQMRSRLTEILVRTMNFGSEQANGEIKRQR